MSDKFPPDWAIKKAAAAAGYDEFHYASAKALPKQNPTVLAFARYIAQHEEAPVDPLLIEAREIAADDYARQDMPGLSRNIREGLFDDNAEVRTVLTALRRGIEIGKAAS